MTIRDLINRESETSLGFSMDDCLKEMKRNKEFLKEYPESNYSKEQYEAEKNMLFGIVQAAMCLKVITTDEYLEICKDIKKNY